MTMPLLALPSRTGDDSQDLDSLWDYVEQLSIFLSNTAASMVDVINEGAGGERTLGTQIPLPAQMWGTPPAPTGVVAMPFYDAVAISWRLVMDPTIQAYEIQRADDAAMTVNVVTLVRTTGFQFLDGKLGGAGVTKSYRVRAYRDTGEISAWSSPQTVTTTTPGQQLVQLALWGTVLQTARVL